MEPQMDGAAGDEIVFELIGFEVIAEYSDFFRSSPAYGVEQLWLTRNV